MDAAQTDASGQVSALRVDGLVKRYGPRRVLDGVSLEVSPGGAVGLVGANGAGKTTLIKCALDLCGFDAGHVAFFGMPSSRAQARARLSYLPERFVPPHYLLGREFIQMTLALAGAPYDAAGVRQTCIDLELDSQALDRPVRQLSKGMTQKLGLAACFLQRRDLTVLDEPMSGLDPAARVAVKSSLARLAGERRALLFTSHVLADVEELCSVLVVLEDGRVRFRGSPAELLARHGGQNLEQAFLRCIRTDADAAAVSA